MVIYKYAEKYNPDTGEPDGVKVDEKIHRCDWSGELWRGGADGPYARFSIQYGGHDPCYGSGGEEYEFGQEFYVSMHTFLSSSRGGPYEIKSLYVEKAVQEFKNSDHEDFASFFRLMRVRTARDLLESGPVKPHQLAGFEFPPDEFHNEEWEELKETELSHLY